MGLALVATAATPPCVLGQVLPRPAASVQSTVRDGERDKGVIWFTLNSQAARFSAPITAFPQADAFWQALVDASNSGRSVTVGFDPTGGAAEPDAGTVTFTPATLDIDGRTIVGATPPPAGPAAPQAMAAVARGVGLSLTPDHAAAIAALDLAAASPNLGKRLQALAYRTRSNLEFDDATSLHRAGPDRDSLLIAALADARRWAAVAPADPDAAFMVANSLRDLGADSEALSAYQAIARTWPDQVFWATIRTAGVLRNQGDFAGALAKLDTLAGTDGPPKSMPFHYHRAWTLSRLGRRQEAVDELTEGLKAQPDYSGAFWRLACTWGQEGNLDQATVNEQTYLDLMKHSGAEDRALPVHRWDEARAEAVIEALSLALQAGGSGAKSNAPCTGFWDDYDEHRAPSPLLAGLAP